MKMAKDKETPVPCGLLLSDDMIFSSRIVGTARDLGLSIKAARSSEILLTLAREQSPRCVIVDLSNPGLVILELLQKLAGMCSPRPKVVAYGSHVDTETLKKAREAGCDIVWPRSKFVEELAKGLPEWILSPGN
jgi:CheY-like chemotaxis protein